MILAMIAGVLVLIGGGVFWKSLLGSDRLYAAVVRLHKKAAPAANDLVAEQATRFAEAADKIRARSETAAKGLAAVGTTAVGAVGFAKFADVFPIPVHFGWLYVLILVAGFADGARTLLWVKE